MKNTKSRVKYPFARRHAVIATASVLALTLQACGSDDSTPAAATPAPTMIEGTVAIGAAVPGAVITVRDADAATADVSGVADANGKYSLDVSSLKAPLVVSAAGTLNGEPVSIVAVVPTLTGNADNTANVTSLTNAVAALIAPGGDLNALTAAAQIAGIQPATVADASALVVNTLRSNPEFATLLGAGFDPLSTPFTANGSGVDAVLDQVAVEVSSSGVAISNLSAPITDSGSPPPPTTLTSAQVSAPSSAPALPASEPASNLPTTAEMTALAKKLETCLALPIAQRVTLSADNEVTSVSATCSFGPVQWKSEGGNWAERVGMNVLRYPSATGAKVGTPTIAAVLAAPNYSGTTFQHPYCNTQTCVVMNIPTTSASGKPSNGLWQVGKIDGQWNFVGNQLPYAMGVEQRLNRKLAVNTALAALNPSNYFLQDRMEAAIRLGFNPDQSGEAAAKVRAVVWKGPGLPAAGVVTHRSQRCGTDDRFPITNQEGLLTVNNSSTLQFWQNGGGVDFIVDAARLDGSALAMPAPTTNWATNTAPANQDIRSTPFTGTAAAWSTYTAEIYYFTNTGSTPDEVVHVRNGTPFEPAAAGATKNWPTLASSFIEQYLTPTGSNAGSLTGLDRTMSWTNPADGYVNFAYLFSQNRVTATNSQSETAGYWKRSNQFFRLNALGDSSAPAYEWAANQSGTSLSSYTDIAGTNPNPRCGLDEVLPLDGDNTRSAYREAGLQTRGADRKLHQLIHFWSN